MTQETTFYSRFWMKVDRLGQDECWPWLAARNKGGYGVIGMGGRRGGNILSHRAAWEIHNGKIPDKLLVCHKCDNRPCCNPRHLFLGTHKDNNSDRSRKGRTVTVAQRGENNHFAKLTSEQVAAIRSESAAGMKGRIIAKKYGVTRQLIFLIIKNKIWKTNDNKAESEST